ncbi:LysR family transcriptional regulator ArgP [Agrobacterium tumefaciens]|uniref:LysR family transcriptional regulator ArgP n=1 Tax=Agrobacterium tumefaciens TaxID=358 RepID=UPI003BA21957
MALIHPQLEAFLAVLEETSFEAAARHLSITPSAVSQRIKALEDRLGQPLIIRQLPCRPTAAGKKLLRRLRPMRALEAEALADFLPHESGSALNRPIALAVNDDSLATWLIAALARLHDAHGYLFDVTVDDQDHTLDLLREGAVLAAITAEATPLQGCTVRTLGAMRYRAVASPEFVARYFASGVDASTLKQAPMIVFNRKDALQSRFIRLITRAHIAPPVHYLPTAIGFVDAAAQGLGWCLAPESLIEDALASRRIVMVGPERWLDVPLYLQHAAIASQTLQRLSDALQHTASRALHR